MHIKMVYFVLALLTNTLSTQMFCFPNLSSATAYAQDHEEYPHPDNDNLLSPNYESFYKKNLPGWLSSIAQFVGLKKKPLWNSNLFKDTLEAIIETREKNGYRGRFIEKLDPVENSRFIIFGDLNGAFHSLLRDLQELNTMNIIDTDFKIIKENTFIIFNGNAIDFSPYILETLTLIMRIMLANPTTVFYIRGQHEDKEYWYNFGLRQELELRAAHLSSETIPLASLVNRFFNTLPLALYLVERTGDTYNAARISPSSRRNAEINAEDTGNFFAEAGMSPNIFHLSNKAPTKLKIDVKAILRADERSSTYTPTKGLLNVEPDQGATAWTILSSPIRTNRTLYEFFFDAFVILTTKSPTMNDWTISLYNRDVRDLQTFSLTKTYNLVTGQEIAPQLLSSISETPRQQVQELEHLKNENTKLNQELLACQQKTVCQPTIQESTALENNPPEQSTPTGTHNDGEIVVGTTLDLSRYYKGESSDTYEGLQLAIGQANQQGGINGKKIKLIVLNDEYDPTKARQNVELLRTKYNASIILSPVGSLPLSGFMDLIEDKKIVLLFPDTGSIVPRNKHLSNIIYYRGSYGTINPKLFSYAQEHLNAKRFAIFYAEDLSSQGIEEQLKKAHIREADRIMVPYDPKTLSFATHAQAIKEFNPDTIALLGSARPAQALIKEIGVENLLNKNLISSEHGDTQFWNFVKELGLQGKFVDTQNIPNPRTSSIQILEEYRKAIHNPAKIDAYSATGYVVGSLFVDALKRIDGPITNESLLQVLENTKNYNFKGLELNFDPQNRELSPYVWFDTGKSEWIKIPLREESTNMPPAAIAQPENPQALSPDDQQEIVIGSTMDLSKSMATQGKETRFGLFKAIEKANREGGINGKRIRLIVLDDENDSEIARKNVEKLMTNYNVDIILSPLEIVTIQGFMDFIRKGKIALLFPASGSPALTEATLSHVVTIRPSYADTDIASVLYAKNVWNAKKIAFLASQDEINVDLEKHLQLAQVPSTDYKIFFQNPTSTEFKPIIKEILEFAPNVIVLFTLSGSAIEFLRQIGSQKLSNIKLIGNEFDEDAFRNFITSQGLDHQYIDIENLPNPQTNQLEIVQEYRKEIGTAKPNTFSLEGYINGSLFVDLARRTQGPITKDSILKTAENIKDYNYKGLLLNFNPKTRQLYDQIWVAIPGQKEWKPFEFDTKKVAPTQNH